VAAHRTGVARRKENELPQKGTKVTND
jgi:hypothetical protein